MKNLINQKLVIKRIKEDSAEYLSPKNPIDNAESCVEYWKNQISSREDYESNKEHLVVVLLDTKLRALGHHVVSVGCLNECVAHPREIFTPAILTGAYGFVLMHNHPSGDPVPSAADRSLTSRLREGSSLLMINFIDHVIVNDINNDKFSFREAGLV